MKQTAVIIEDSPTVRFFLRKQFLDLDVEVLGEASNEQEIRELFKLLTRKKISPNFIMLDIVLPETTGDRLISMFKRLHPESHIIVLTSINCDISKSECIEKGAKEYFIKPITTEQMESFIVS